MQTSFLEIATFMDPVEPPASLRQLARRHRWLGKDPPPVVSLREIAARHDNPATTHHRFLWYNTFLLQGFELSFCNLIILGRLLEKLGLDPRKVLGEIGVGPNQIVNTMNISKRQIVDGLGKSLDDLKDAFASLIGKIPIIRNLGIGDILKKVSMKKLMNKFNVTLDDLLDKLKLDPLTILSKFCKETLSFISNQTGFPLDASVHIMGKPERPARAKEIGETTAPDYEIIALCEVFEKSSRSSIAKEAKSRRSSLDTATGPDDTGEFASSGLLTLVLDRKITGRDHFAFNHKGEPLRDADAWSNKGVLRTVVDVGLGKVEVYSTHLLSGGGIDIEKLVLRNIPGYDDEAAADIFRTKKDQLDELVDFVQKTHNPQNVAIVVGDFNLSAQDEDEYNALVQRMHKLGMLDLWPFHRHRSTPSKKDLEKDLEGNILPRGDTHASNDDNNSSRVGLVCHPEKGPYCDESAKTENTSRIDYIFIENPRPEHTFTIDLTRIRRRPFHRPHAAGDQERFLSDHLGLDCTFIVSPR